MTSKSLYYEAQITLMKKLQDLCIRDTRWTKANGLVIKFDSSCDHVTMKFLPVTVDFLVFVQLFDDKRKFT